MPLCFENCREKSRQQIEQVKASRANRADGYALTLLCIAAAEEWCAKYAQGERLWSKCVFCSLHPGPFLTDVAGIGGALQVYYGDMPRPYQFAWSLLDDRE